MLAQKFHLFEQYNELLASLFKLRTPLHSHALNKHSTEALLTSLICPICRRFFTHPAYLPCSHRFCHQCIHKDLTRNSQRPRCPVCKASLSQDTVPIADKFTSLLLQEVAHSLQKQNVEKLNEYYQQLEEWEFYEMSTEYYEKTKASKNKMEESEFFMKEESSSIQVKQMKHVYSQAVCKSADDETETMVGASRPSNKQKLIDITKQNSIKDQQLQAVQSVAREITPEPVKQFYLVHFVKLSNFVNFVLKYIDGVVFCPINATGSDLKELLAKKLCIRQVNCIMNPIIKEFNYTIQDEETLQSIFDPQKGRGKRKYKLKQLINLSAKKLKEEDKIIVVYSVNVKMFTDFLLSTQ